MKYFLILAYYFFSSSFFKRSSIELNTERITKTRRLKHINIAETGIQIFELFHEAKDAIIASTIKPMDDGKNILLFILIFLFKFGKNLFLCA